TDVEGTHRQLRARLTDGLSGNDTNRFTLVHQVAPAQVAPVAVRAQAITRFASQRRAHLDFVNADAVDVFDQIFIEQGSGGHGSFLGVGVDDVDRRHTTQNTVTQGFDDFTAFDQRFHGIAARRSA